MAWSTAVTVQGVRGKAKAPSSLRMSRTGREPFSDSGRPTRVMFESAFQTVRGSAPSAGTRHRAIPQPTETPFVLGERTGGGIFRFAAD